MTFSWTPAGIAALVIKGYSSYISPLFPARCRFTPTCSEYALEALHKYGFVKGALRSAHRLLRCHPFSPGGLDPLR